MANSTNIQTLVDGPRNLVMKMTGSLDTSDLANTKFVDPSTSFVVSSAGGNTPPLVRVDYIDYSIADGLELTLSWGNATGPLGPMLPIAGRGRMNFTEFEGLRNNVGGSDGSIWVFSNGYSTGIKIFSLILEMVKEGLTYAGGSR